ncbi:MAG: nucleotide exchange factor GrpE [Chloroflexi bacterium]|nr:MAG: nucleotide exchange factor GrpE [Chloroflexota bacterium]
MIEDRGVMSDELIQRLEEITDSLAELMAQAAGEREQLDRLHTSVEALKNWPEALDRRLAEVLTAVAGFQEELEDLRKELKRLGRAQFKANTLDEARLERWQQAIEAAQAAVARRDGEIAALHRRLREAIAEARHQWLAELLPLLDSLDETLAAGREQLARFEERKRQEASKRWWQRLRSSLAGDSFNAEACRSLAGWLEGVRLLRERVWAFLEEAGVRPIPAVGETFDPHRHVAVGTEERDDVPEGVIVAEQRRGYISPAGILRFAEVIVAKAPSQAEEKKEVENRSSETHIR